MKILFFFLLTVCTLPVCAQVAVGVVGGYSRTALKVQYQKELIPTGTTSSVEDKFDPKWRAGLIMDIHLAKRFYLQPQLLFSKKGDNKEDKTLYNGSETSTFTQQERLSYLELPLNLVYKVPLGINGKFIAGAGPYIAGALSGSYSTHRVSKDENGTVIADGREEGKIFFKNKKPSSARGPYYYKRQDMGLNFLTGYEWKNGLSLQANYSMGLTNAFTHLFQFSVEPTQNPRIKNRYFGLSAAYLFKL